MSKDKGMPVIEHALDISEQRAQSSLQTLPAYLPWLDVLRFLACFLVIVSHCSLGIHANLGHAGVALFFSISGFLIGGVLDEDRNLSRFYARRFLRIYPAYLTTIALFGVLSTPALAHGAETGRLFWHNLQYYLTFTFQLSPDRDHLPLLIVWSLCVEELFYLLLPVLFLLRKRSKIGIALAGIVALLLIPRFFLLPDGSGTWFIFPINLFLGVSLALLRPRLRNGFPYIAIGCVALMIANAALDWFHQFGPLSALLCTSAVYSLAVLDARLPMVLDPFRRMGRLSYGIYLLHLFCLSLTLRILAKFPSFHYAIVVISMTTAFAVLTAWAMQVCIENPFLKLRRLIGRNAKMRYALASIQVGLIPTGILLAVIQRHGR